MEVLPGGTQIPVHSHDRYEEIIFIHDGVTSLTLGDDVVTAEPGTTMHVAPGVWHGVANNSDEDAKMLFIFPEPKIAAFFREVGYSEGEEPPVLSAEDWDRIMTQHGMRARPPGEAPE